jgi:hypothetical protein
MITSMSTKKQGGSIHFFFRQGPRWIVEPRADIANTNTSEVSMENNTNTCQVSMEDGTQQGSGIHPSIPKSSQMYTQLLCTSPHKGASTTILDYTDSPPSQKKTSPALPISPGRIPSPTPNYKNTLPAYPQHVPSSSSTPNTNLHLLIPPHKLYPRPIPPPHKKKLRIPGQQYYNH